MRYTKPDARIIHAGADGGFPEGEERVVLRLAREPLRADPPRVRFIGRSVARIEKGTLPWPAFDLR
jgi:hypothetical protein